jgi:DNA-binding GntR family transcriptional regulator
LPSSGALRYPLGMSLLTVPVAPTQAEEVYSHLKTKLMQGAILPGAKLSIRKLAEDLDTGMSPVREALKRLASERVLSSHAKRSYVVPVLDPKRAADLFNLRALLECEAAIQALPFIDVQTIRRLTACSRKMHAAIRDRQHDVYMTENHRFHFIVYGLCGNADMIAVIEQLWMQTGPTLRKGLEDVKPDHSWREIHEALVRAFSQKDEEDLRACMLQDIRWNWTEAQPELP